MAFGHALGDAIAARSAARRRRDLWRDARDHRPNSQRERRDVDLAAVALDRLDRRRCDILGRARADARRKLRARAGEHARVADEAGQDGRYSDALIAQVRAQPRGEATQAELRRVVQQRARCRRLAAERGHEHHVPGATADHPRQQRVRERDRCTQVHRQGSVDLLHRERLQRSRRRQRCIVDQDVHLAGLAGQAVDLARLDQIDRPRARVELASQRLEHVRAASGQQQLAAALGHGPRNRLADTAGGCGEKHARPRDLHLAKPMQIRRRRPTRRRRSRRPRRRAAILRAMSPSKPTPTPSAGSGRTTVIALFGPTGVGKTAIAVALAQLLRARGETPVAVSADALQVYAGLETLTGVASAGERAALDHRLLSFVPLDATFSVGQYAKLAHAQIDALLAAGHRPIVVGGTGLYLRAALADLDLRPEPAPGIRERLMADLQLHGAPELHRRLAQGAAWAAQGIDERDWRRIVRALELLEAGELQPPQGPSQLWSDELRHPTLLAALTMQREALYERIDARVDQMLAS